MARVLREVVGIAVVLAVPAYVLAMLLAPWLVDGMGQNRRAAAGLQDVPTELWPLLVLPPLAWTVVGVRVVWQRL